MQLQLTEHQSYKWMKALIKINFTFINQAQFFIVLYYVTILLWMIALSDHQNWLKVIYKEVLRTLYNLQKSLLSRYRCTFSSVRFTVKIIYSL